MQTIPRVWLGLGLAFVFVVGCEQKPTQTDRPADRPVEPNPTHKTEPSEPSSKFGKITGPSVSVEVQSQRTWEAKWAALIAEINEAQRSGNQLVVKRKQEAFETFLKNTMSSGVVLESWIGGVSDIRETVEKYPDDKGKPALTATLSLSDSSANQVPRINLFNYDWDAKRSTGLEKEFEALKSGQVIRVWGRISKSIAPFGAHLTVTRIELVDYAKERASRIDRGDKLVARFSKAAEKQKTAISPRMPEGIRGRNIGGYQLYYSQLSRLYPEWRPTVKEHNEFEAVLSDDDIVKIPDAITKYVTRLKTERFVDDSFASYMDSAEAKLTKAEPAIEKALKNIESLGDMMVKGLRDPKRDRDNNAEDGVTPYRFTD